MFSLVRALPPTSSAEACASLFARRKGVTYLFFARFPRCQPDTFFPLATPEREFCRSREALLETLALSYRARARYG